MDYSKYEYVNFEGRPNVWLGFHVGTPSAEAKRYQIDGVVLKTARIMFAKNSRNTYIFTGARSETNPVGNFARCTIERDDEVLGSLVACYGRKGHSVAVDNERIRRERDRGGAMTTSDEKRAAALALKKFVPVPNEEVLLKAYGEINAILRQRVNGVQSRKNNALQEKANDILAYVEKNWDDKGQALLKQVGVPASALPMITNAIEDHRNHASLRARTDKGLTFVYQKGDTLYAAPFKLTGERDLHQRAYAYEDAPGDLRAKVGMLKVADEGEYHPDWGMRLGLNSYVIFFDLAEEGAEDADADADD